MQNNYYSSDSGNFYSPVERPSPSYQPDVATIDLEDTTFDQESEITDYSFNPYKQQQFRTSDEPIKGVRYEETINSLESQPELQNERRLFSWLFSSNVPRVPSEEEREFYPWHRTSYFMRLGFWWLWPILKKGYKRTLHADDLYKLTPELTVEEMHRNFSHHLEDILSKEKINHLKQHQDLSDFKWSNFAIPYALFLTFKKQYVFATACLSLALTLTSLSPLVTRQLIDFVEYKYFKIETSYSKGIGYTFLSVILIFLNGLLLNHFFHNAMIVGAQTKSVLTKSLLVKSFSVSNKSKFLFPVGRITSLMSTDLSRIDLAIGFQPLILCFPIPVIISITILLINIGVASLTGICLFIVSLVVCALLTKKLFTTREKVVKFTDDRVSLIREALNNMKIIKFYAWEMAYKLAITKIRHQEMKYLFTIKVLRNFITAYAVTLPVLTSMISFITMWATDSMKSPGEVFSSLSLYAILAQSIMLLPIALASGADALIGFTRCKEYLSAEELDEELHKNLVKYEDEFYIDHSHDVAIEVKDADFIWESFHDELDETAEMSSDDESVLTYTSSMNSSTQFAGLHKINLSVKKGEFVIITGVIGSGKTSLLNALAGTMKLNNPGVGQVKIYQDAVLCSEPWIQNATVKENIVFGKPWDPELYQKVLFSCALIDDMKLLPYGDRTEIGERGVTLSGGQKARINLARAIYANSSTILLDDVISAVDSKVAKHIVNHLFKDLLKGKTIVLATHQLGILEYADRVVFLNGDGTVDQGTVNELASSNKDFKTLLEFSSDAESTAGSNYSLPQREKQQQEHDDGLMSKTFESTGDLVGRTTTDEERATNAISWNVYKQYFKLGSGKFGKFAGPILLVLIMIATFFQVFTNTWLSFWVEKKFKDKSDHYYITFYVLFAFLTVIFTGIEFMMLEYLQNHAAKILNVKAMEKILHAPMWYMDTTPLGRILNRFTKDTDSLDNEIGEQMRLFVFPLALLIGIMILCTCYLPYFAIAVPFLVFAFVFLANFYQGASREIKRLEATQRSLVYNNFNETLTGMTTIKSFGANEAFIQKNDYFLNRMNEAYFLSIATQRWLCVSLDMITCCVVLIVCLLCITETVHISPASTGLLINYCLQIIGILSLSVRSMTQVETEMNSVERIYQYAFELPQEAAYSIPEAAPTPAWPQSGYITFKNVSLRYRPNLPLVLKGLDANFYPGEKVGIVGRTGAGKSSIMSALYRLTELETGSIEIDGVDISKLGLKELRSKLSIIPQDPVLFQGTIRKNLDPFDEYEDDVLYEALINAGLVNKFEPHTGKFNFDNIVDDDGNNYSLGERQLIALARALVRDSKILVMDEATSSVDFSTDHQIQNTIARNFSQSTILCIAHRLKTVLSYERVLVMDAGQVKEFDTPWKLFNTPGSLFREMCLKANITRDDFM
ncbi:YOR1 Oligomycin resistance ATP-dependent permease YOR1 [Candida maltosa Xu316]